MLIIVKWTYNFCNRPQRQIISTIIGGHPSRNELMVKMMRKFGICEERSTGIDRVIHEVEVHQLPAPDFQADHQQTVVKFHGHRNFE
ncbi:MAG: hypothetical protein OXE56_08965 [Gammaproteobacteria bacterium]|nr:hypothetical protein [Gammaproteobacteria bacterium]